MNYGFANCAIYRDEAPVLPDSLPVEKGIEEEAAVKPEGIFSYVCLDGVKPEDITSEVTMEEALIAPVEEGSVVGSIGYYLNGTQIGEMPIVAAQGVERAGFLDYMGRMLLEYLRICAEISD